MATSSEITVYDTLNTCWEKFAPIKITLNDTVLWDDMEEESSMNSLRKIKQILENEEYKEMYVSSILIKTVAFHHSEITITTA